MKSVYLFLLSSGSSSALQPPFLVAADSTDKLVSKLKKKISEKTTDPSLKIAQKILKAELRAFKKEFTELNGRNDPDTLLVRQACDALLSKKGADGSSLNFEFIDEFAQSLSNVHSELGNKAEALQIMVPGHATALHVMALYSSTLGFELYAAHSQETVLAMVNAKCKAAPKEAQSVLPALLDDGIEELEQAKAYRLAEGLNWYKREQAFLERMKGARTQAEVALSKEDLLALEPECYDAFWNHAEALHFCKALI